jgi:hypothetical protein
MYLSTLQGKRTLERPNTEVNPLLNGKRAGPLSILLCGICWCFTFYVMIHPTLEFGWSMRQVKVESYLMLLFGLLFFVSLGCLLFRWPIGLFVGVPAGSIWGIIVSERFARFDPWYFMHYNTMIFGFLILVSGVGFALSIKNASQNRGG